MSTKQQFDFSINLLEALIWQYNDAPRLESLLRQKQAWYDTNQRDFWAGWLRDVFDLRTANRFGLTVWSIILGIPLNIALPPSGRLNKFGFGQYNRNFNRGNFGSMGSGSSALSIENARQLLQLRYFNLVTRPTIPQINRMLANIFKDGEKVYAIGHFDMSNIVYVFNFQPAQLFKNALLEYDVLPRPATIGASILYQRRSVFGFGPYNINFNRSNFAGE